MTRAWHDTPCVLACLLLVAPTSTHSITLGQAALMVVMGLATIAALLRLDNWVAKQREARFEADAQKDTQHWASFMPPERYNRPSSFEPSVPWSTRTSQLRDRGKRRKE